MYFYCKIIIESISYIWNVLDNLKRCVKQFKKYTIHKIIFKENHKIERKLLVRIKWFIQQTLYIQSWLHFSKKSNNFLWHKIFYIFLETFHKKKFLLRLFRTVFMVHRKYWFFFMLNTITWYAAFCSSYKCSRSSSCACSIRRNSCRWNFVYCSVRRKSSKRRCYSRKYKYFYLNLKFYIN